MNQINNLTLAETIAYRNGDEANAYMVAKGLPASTTAQELATRIAKYITKNGDKGLEEMMVVHPDREFFEATITPEPEPQNKFNNFNNGGASNFMQTPFMQSPYFNNCSGCGGTCGGHNNANGASAAQNAIAHIPMMDKSTAITALAMVAIIGVFALVLTKH